MLEQEKIWKLLIKFSVPAIIGMMVNGLYNVVDRIFVVKGVGESALSGIAISFPITIVIMAFGMLVGIGSANLISIRLGEKDKEGAQRILNHSLVCAVVIGVALTAMILPFVRHILTAFGAVGSDLEYGVSYMRIIAIGAVFQMVGFGLNHPIRAAGHPKVAMGTMLLGAITNTVLDAVFIFLFDWGVQGAALATIIAQAASMLYALMFVFGDKMNVRCNLKGFKLQPRVAMEAFALGLPNFVLQLTAGLISTLFNKGFTTYGVDGGTIEIAGFTAVNSVTMLILMTVFGVNQGVQPIVGYNHGAGSKKRSISAYILAMLVATGICTIGTVIVLAFPRQIMWLFSKDSEELLEFGVKALRIDLFSLPVVGAQIITTAYFQATDRPAMSLFLSMCRQIILLIPMIIIFPMYLGVDGLLYAVPASDLASAVVMGAFVFKELRLRKYELKTS